ncbi:cytochrome P450 [Pelagerythrobacter aerophilus]|uniref:Cytochrome P450 n=1 Tax=Pelagerythrobacter aerophilus TaxID=2306995 RepID=A0A418NIX8_9SPHN|nr:cytochrome P450 [Pelagerythrobacter aerophilus]
MTSAELAAGNCQASVQRTGPDSWLVNCRNAALDAELQNARCTRFPARHHGFFSKRRDPVLWQDVRRVITKASRAARIRLPARNLYEGIAKRFDAGTREQPQDLTYFVMSTLANATLPMIIDDEASIAGLSLDQNDKITKQINFHHLRHGFWQRALSMMVEYRAGRAVRKAVAHRIERGDTDKADFLHTLLELEDVIGLRGISYLIVTLSSAVSTAPGAIASCMLYKLLLDEERFERVHEELADWDVASIAQIDHGQFKYCQRFIKEALRLWSFPLRARRLVHTDMWIDGELICKGDVYDLSFEHFHRDSAVWDDAASFHEERWLSPSEAQMKSYFPFGFSKRSCLGASIGLDQLLIFLRLATVDFQFLLADDAKPKLSSEILHVPSDFVGTFRRK